jgi:hypothetical protein
MYDLPSKSLPVEEAVKLINGEITSQIEGFYPRGDPPFGG